MIDVNKGLRDVLLADATISGLVGTRVHAGRLPEEYDFEEKPQAIVIASPGEEHRDNSTLVDVIATFECYGSDTGEADAVKRAVHDYLDGLRNTAVGEFHVVETRHIDTVGLAEDPDVRDLWEADVIFRIQMKRD